jgi:hypothetical protein
LPGGLKRNPERKKHFLETSGETVSYMKRIRKLQVSEYLWKTSPTGNPFKSGLWSSISAVAFK